MTSPYSLMMNELRRRKIAHANIFAPYFIASVGSHMFNLINQGKYTWTSGADIVNARLHILMVAPPGASKSTFINQHVKNYVGLIHGSDIPCTKKGSLTAAALTGSVKPGPEGPIVTEGVAKKEAEAIIGIEEFSFINAANKQLHNAEMEPTFLQLLDDGHVVLDRAAGGIDYYSQLTLWGGVQPAKYELGGGMGRRMWFVLFTPTWEDLELIRVAMRDGRNIQVDHNISTNIKKVINDRFDEIKKRVTRIEFDRRLEQYFIQQRVPSFETLLYERLALGYTLMKLEQITSTITIYLTPELEQLFNYGDWSRFAIRESPHRALIKGLLMGRPQVAESELFRQLLAWGVDYSEIITQLKSMERLKHITKQGDYYSVLRSDLFVDPIKKYFGDNARKL